MPSSLTPSQAALPADAAVPPPAASANHAASSSSSSSAPAALLQLDARILSNAHRADLHADEYFDVLDADGRPTGERKLRRLVHQHGDWHACVHVWLQHAATGQLLVQRRASCKDSFPSCWDVSCAGHLSSGEVAEAAAQAELAEELGVSKPSGVAFEQFFRQLPTMKREVISQQGRFIDREVTYIYAVEGRWRTSDFVLQAEEVEAVEWRDVDDVVRSFEQQLPDWVSMPDIAEYRRVVFEPLRQRAQQIQQAAATGTAAAAPPGQESDGAH